MKGSKELALQSVLSLGIPRDLQLVYTGEKETAGPKREAQAPLGPMKAVQTQALKISRALPSARLPPSPFRARRRSVCSQFEIWVWSLNAGMRGQQTGYAEVRPTPGL